MIWSNIGGDIGCRVEIERGSSLRIAPIKLAWLFPSNVFTPVTIS